MTLLIVEGVLGCVFIIGLVVWAKKCKIVECGPVKCEGDTKRESEVQKMALEAITHHHGHFHGRTIAAAVDSVDSSLTS